MFLTLCLSENRNMFLFGSISQFDFNLCINTAIIFASLSSRVSKLSDLTICVTLIRYRPKHLLVMNRAALSEFDLIFQSFL